MLIRPDAGGGFLSVAALLCLTLGAVVAGLIVPVDLADHVEGEYELLLISPGPRVLDVIKELRAWCGMSYRRARTSCDTTPSSFRVGATAQQAEQIADRLRRAGAVVELPASLG